MSAIYSFRGSPSSDFGVDNLWTRRSNIQSSSNTTIINLTVDEVPNTQRIQVEKKTTNDFLVTDGFETALEGPSTGRFVKRLPLSVKIKTAWLLLDAVSFLYDRLLGSAPTCPHPIDNNLNCCVFVTEDYKEATRMNAPISNLFIEFDPTVSYASDINYSDALSTGRRTNPAILIGETYTTLQNWLFGNYISFSSTGNDGSVSNTRGIVLANNASNGQFYLESVHIDNSNDNSVLVFHFKTTPTKVGTANVTLGANNRIWVYYM
jgi:hypothetical protein